MTIGEGMVNYIAYIQGHMNTVKNNKAVLCGSAWASL